jgi:hypothetical protein
VGEDSNCISALLNSRRNNRSPIRLSLPMNFKRLPVRGKRPSHRLTRIDTDSEEEALKFNFGGSKVDQQTE